MLTGSVSEDQPRDVVNSRCRTTRPVSASVCLTSGFGCGEDVDPPPDGDEEHAVSAKARQAATTILRSMGRNITLAFRRQSEAVGLGINLGNGLSTMNEWFSGQMDRFAHFSTSVEE